MTDSIGINLAFDYQSLRYKISALYNARSFPSTSYTTELFSNSGFASPGTVSTLLGGVISSTASSAYQLPYSILDSDGTPMAAGYILQHSIVQGRSYGSTTPKFGINDVGGFGYDRGSENSSVYITNPFSEMRVDYNVDPTLYSSYAGLSGQIVDYLINLDTFLSKKNDSYVSVPVQFSRGDASLNAKVTAQQNNRITWDNPFLVTSVGTTDFTDAKLSVLSGVESGNSFRVVSYDNSNKYLYLDKSGSFVNSIIQVAPRATVMAYSGWSDSAQVRCKFDLNKSFPVGMGYYSGVVSYSGQSTYELTPGVNVLTDTVTIPKDIYMRAPEFGDIFMFKTPSSVTASGLIVSVSHNSSTYGIQYYPRQQPGTTPPNNAFTLKRTAKFDLEYYPQFGKNYTLVSYIDGSSLEAGIVNVPAPTATLEIAAGDYDSSFSSVTDTSHFHIGPIHLSDGSVLTGTNILISGSLYNNNPTSNVPLGTWNRFTSASTNVAPVYSGLYAKNGSLITVLPNSFTTPDMLTLIASASVGSSTINKIINLPVQPPV